ncbi:hypothetical protein RJ641_028683 [Dillenia turbinata]|uniref:Uncharacterized protein n=1 Tax=Dillenia turbinata TaxID=194707 RepID=A0AAN8ZMJ1_9MAGN
MDMNLLNASLELPQSRLFANITGDVLVDHSNPEEACSLCQRIFSPDNESTEDLQNIALCGYCKLVLLEDHGTSVHSSHLRRQSRRRRTRYSSTESLEDLFLQQFFLMINLVRQNQLPASQHVDHPADAHAESGAARETESNISLSGYTALHTQSDAISFNAYAGDSDAAVDRFSVLETEMSVQPGDESELDTDTDIDPMHAGQSHCYLDGQEEEDADGEGEEADAEEKTVRNRTNILMLGGEWPSDLCERARDGEESDSMHIHAIGKPINYTFQ